MKSMREEKKRKLKAKRFNRFPLRGRFAGPLIRIIILFNGVETGGAGAVLPRAYAAFMTKARKLRAIRSP